MSTSDDGFLRTLFPAIIELHLHHMGGRHARTNGSGGYRSRAGDPRAQSHCGGGRWSSAPDGLTPIVAQLKALQRHEPAGSANMIAGYLAEIAASGSLDTQSLDAELNGIAQGLQQIELERQYEPHNGLVGTVVNELDEYILANGGTLGGGGGGGGGGGSGPGA